MSLKVCFVEESKCSHHDQKACEIHSFNNSVIPSSNISGHRGIWVERDGSKMETVVGSVNTDFVYKWIDLGARLFNFPLHLYHVTSGA